MRFSSILLCALLSFSIGRSGHLFGGYTNIGGRWSPDTYVPTNSVQEHYDFGTQAFHEKRYQDALAHFMVILYHFEDSPFFQDSLFYSGLSFYFLEDYDLANRQLDAYLNLSGKLKHFQTAFEYKLAIANCFAQGKKKHLFGFTTLPKWSSGKGYAFEIYDEIIAALPGKDIAAEALYQKAELLKATRQYRDCIEALQIITRRYPKHPLAAQSYLRISEIYLEQSKRESQNPDLIALAQVNIQRFRKSFPSDEAIDLANNNLIAMHEVYAQSLYDTGRFYERKKKPHASSIYYQDAVYKYPGTQAAEKCRQKLVQLGFRASSPGSIADNS